MENFITTDIRLASYLRVKRCEMLEIQDGVSSNRCEFIFENTDELKKYISEWQSPENDFLRDVLFQQSILKKEVRNKYNNKDTWKDMNY